MLDKYYCFSTTLAIYLALQNLIPLRDRPVGNLGYLSFLCTFDACYIGGQDYCKTCVIRSSIAYGT